MSILGDFFKLTPAKGSPKLSRSMTTTPVLFVCFVLFFSFFIFQLGMIFHLCKRYDVMQSRLARKPTYHLI